MTDYIERDELVSYFKEIATETLRDGSVQCVLGAGVIAHMIVEIKEFPAADVRPVVRGKWAIGECGLYSCSVCGQMAPYDVQADVIEYWPSLNFCPNCGADMRPPASPIYVPKEERSADDD